MSGDATSASRTSCKARITGEWRTMFMEFIIQNKRAEKRIEFPCDEDKYQLICKDLNAICFFEVNVFPDVMRKYERSRRIQH